MRTALTDIYSYYEANEQMLSNSLRDIDVMPEFVGDLMQAQVDSIHAALLQPWGEGDRRLATAVGHAIDFKTWESLTGQGLDAYEAARLMADMVGCLAGWEDGAPGSR